MATARASDDKTDAATADATKTLQSESETPVLRAEFDKLRILAENLHKQVNGALPPEYTGE